MTEQEKNQPVASSPSEAKEAAQRKAKKRKEILIGSAIAVCLIAAGAGLLHHFIDSHGPVGPSTVVEADAGLIDWQQVIEAHPDYQQLQSLQDECKTLERQTQSVDDLFKVSPPDGNPKPFEDAVWQKNFCTSCAHTPAGADWTFSPAPTRSSRRARRPCSYHRAA